MRYIAVSRPDLTFGNWYLVCFPSRVWEGGGGRGGGQGGQSLPLPVPRSPMFMLMFIVHINYVKRRENEVKRGIHSPVAICDLPMS